MGEEIIDIDHFIKDTLRQFIDKGLMSDRLDLSDRRSDVLPSWIGKLTLLDRWR